MNVILSIPVDEAAALAIEPAVADTVVLEIRGAQDRRMVTEQIERLSRRSFRCFVRIRPLDEDGDGDLAAALGGQPAAIVLPRVVGAADVQRLGVVLAVLEAELGFRDGATGIVAVGADTPAGVLALPSLPGSSPRLAGIAVDEAALGLGEAVALRDTAHALTILSARAAGVPSLAMPAPGYDAAALRRSGFSAILVRSVAEAVASRTT